MTAEIIAKTISPLSGLLGKDQKRHRQNNAQPFSVEEHVEDWELKASDALREEILSSYIPVSDEELTRIFKDDDDRDDDLSSSGEAETIPLLDEAAEAALVQTDAQEPDTASTAPAREKSLGVFSDSRIHSAMIQDELKRHDVTIKHFDHPASFQPERFDLFDSIDAWIVFLSDAYEGDFLEQFLERYADTPTLFLFEESKQQRTSHNIEQFLADNHLTRVKPIKPWDHHKHMAKNRVHARPQPRKGSPGNPHHARESTPGTRPLRA